MEKLISEINQQLIIIEAAIAEDKIPDFKTINKKIEEFTGQLKNLDAPSAKQYQQLLSTWSIEIRKSSEILNAKIDNIRTELSAIQNQNKAIKGYNYINQ